MAARRDLLLADKNHIETQFLYVEQNYYQFSTSSSLADILDGFSDSDRTIVYSYISDVVSLVKNVKNINPLIQDVQIYTSNERSAQLLSNFYQIDELYNRELTKAFRLDPQRELTNHFWCFSGDEQSLKFSFIAGIVNLRHPQVTGVIEFVCDEQFFAPLWEALDENESVYLYQGDQLFYSVLSTEESDLFLRENLQLLLTDSIEDAVSIIEKGDTLAGIIRLQEQDITIVRLSSSAKTSLNLFSGYYVVFMAVFLLANVILLPTIYKPLKNVSRLAGHMRATRSHQLRVYQGEITSDEVGDLIAEYNSLVDRTNTLSDTVHQNEILLRNAQIKALQAQLNPHFFYGTLESIRMIAEAHHEELIADITYAFGELMRYSLSDEYLVPIRREVQIVRQYLQIQQKRIAERFSVEWEENISDQEWACPKFVLFSMIENVFVHDVSQTRRQVHITISIQQNGEDMDITVSNDGPGIPAERLWQLEQLRSHSELRAALSSHNNGRSIMNINDRLQLYYGDNYRFDITSEENVKTTCHVRIHNRINEKNLM